MTGGGGKPRRICQYQKDGIWLLAVERQHIRRIRLGEPRICAAQRDIPQQKPKARSARSAGPRLFKAATIEIGKPVHGCQRAIMPGRNTSQHQFDHLDRIPGLRWRQVLCPSGGHCETQTHDRPGTSQDHQSNAGIPPHMECICWVQSQSNGRPRSTDSSEILTVMLPLSFGVISDHI